MNFFVSYFNKFLLRLEYTNHNGSKERLPEIIRIFWVLVSTFTCVIVLLATFRYPKFFQQHHVPEIVPSWAATIILTCNGLESPLGQPKNLFVGTMLSSILGIVLTKLWLLHLHEDTLWLCSVLSLSLSSIMMSALNIIHPAAGTAALLYPLLKETRDMDWMYLLVQLITSFEIIAVSAIFANIYSVYPLYWWDNKVKNKPISTLPVVSKSSTTSSTMSNDSDTTVVADKEDNFSSKISDFNDQDIFYISSSSYFLPQHVNLQGEELEIMLSIQRKLGFLQST